MFVIIFMVDIILSKYLSSLIITLLMTNNDISYFDLTFELGTTLAINIVPINSGSYYLQRFTPKAHLVIINLILSSFCGFFICIKICCFLFNLL